MPSKPARMPERGEVDELQADVVYAAYVVERYGEVYAPILDRLYAELTAAEKAQEPRAKARRILHQAVRQAARSDGERTSLAVSFDETFAGERGEMLRASLAQPIHAPRACEVERYSFVRRRIEEPGTIYLIGYADYVKIGFTDREVRLRLEALQTGCPEELRIIAALPGARLDESDLHLRFADLRLRGEWFRREGALAEWIEAGCPT